MVYVPSDVNSWQAYARSWLEQFLHRQQIQLQQELQQKLTMDGLAHGQRRSVEAQSASSMPGSQPGGVASTDGTAEKGTLEFIWGMLEVFVDPLLGWLHANGKELIPQEDVGRVTALTVLLESLVLQTR